MKRGLFITFEGPEGCGKSTQSKRLGRFLKRGGFSVVVTRDPGGTRLGESIRKILLNSRNHFSPLSEVFLYELSRSELVRQVIRPALKRRAVVLSDRFFDSTIVYQGVAGGVSIHGIKRLDRKVCGGIEPDLTFLLDVPVKRGLGRSFKKKKFLDRMERKSFTFHQQVRRGYLALSRREPKRFRLIRSAGKEEIQQQIRDEVMHVLKRHLGTRGAGSLS